MQFRDSKLSSKMMRIIIGLMVIFLMNEQGTAFFPIKFLNMNVISWGSKIFNEQTLFGNKFDHISLIKLKKLLGAVDYISYDFDQISNKMNHTQSKRMPVYVDEDSTLNLACLFFKDRCKKQVPDHSQEIVLHEFISTINNVYTDIRNKLVEAEPTYKNLKNSIFHILDKTKILSTTLEKIYQLILPTTHNSTTNFINLTISNAKLFPRYDCNKYLSAQQQMFITYINLIIAEMKGLTILTFVHSLHQRLYNVPSISQTLMTIKQNFEYRTMNYYKYINKIMTLLPRDIHRCEILIPRRGENYIEFTQYHQAKLISSSILDSTHIGSMNCQKKCEEIDLTESNRIIRENVYNCQTLGHSNDVDVCVRSISPRKYLWWKTSDRTYGDNEKCTGKMSYGTEHRTAIRFCYMCMCSVMDTLSISKNKILRISKTSQMADIANNMFVIGVKFVIYDKAVHLQILQSKYVPGEFNDNFTTWKKLDDFTSTRDTKFRYSSLAEVSGQLYIDDVMLPPKHVVTGVRFASRQNSPAGFFLEVHGTPFDIQTGKLQPKDGTWFISGNWEFSKRPDYERDRIKIKMDIPTNPTKCKGYNYNRETNQFVQFHHSDVREDAGQSTVPFIDAQPVEIYPSFPLGGIGLFYRSQFGCGGYIAPRLFAIDITQYVDNNPAE
ncbi:hypothetical protein PV327_005329 [Microctonus hyperodae]|uniref:Uncharacterized protein n=1 Tax=Microctonus hyperodae TaxID=165561 RepID=A0AA39KZQ3_MICHY|nr:hypothetical protein PV327_005329 [Microctonus hyperodae]